MKSCPICSAENPSEAASCQKCGFILDLTGPAWPEYPTVELPQPADAPDWPAWPEVETLSQPAEYPDLDEHPVTEPEERPAPAVALPQVVTAEEDRIDSPIAAVELPKTPTDDDRAEPGIDPTTAKESPKLDVMALLQDLKTEDSVDANLAAVRQLADLNESSYEIVKALVHLEERHPFVAVRKGAAEVLQDPVHQENLERYRRMVKAAAWEPSITPRAISRATPQPTPSATPRAVPRTEPDWWKLILRVILGGILGLIEGSILGFLVFLISGAAIPYVGWLVASAGAIIGALAGPIDRKWIFLETYDKAFKKIFDRGKYFFFYFSLATLLALPEALWALGGWVLGRIRRK